MAKRPRDVHASMRDVNTCHEFRLVCEQNRTTSQEHDGPALNYCPVIGMIIGSN